VFYKGSDTLRERLQTLADHGSGKMMRESTSVRALGIEPRDSYFQRNMLNAFADFPHALHSVVSSSCFLTLIFTDGSRSEEGTGFGIYVPGQQSFGYRLQKPSGVFTADITALLTALHLVGSDQPNEFLILTDSLSSLSSRKISPRTHSVV
jgi:hypothetical protein